jgi:hypothetical protein
VSKLNCKYFSKILKGKNLNQISKLICDELLGKGLYRDVYVLRQNPDYVVKIERNLGTGQFANVCEWRNYINNKDWEWFEKWLAPCEIITYDGQVLIQKRIMHGKKKDYPKLIPAMFTDTKYRNFGWIGTRFVCCDYSFIPFYIIKTGNSKMKKAKWWS